MIKDLCEVGFLSHRPDFFENDLQSSNVFVSFV